MAYFKHLLDLLKIERDEDQKAYLKLIEHASAADRRAAGVTWYPVAIRGTEPSRGDYLTVEIERTTHLDVAHQLKFGASAALFSNHNAGSNRQEGIITYQGGNRLKINLFTDELPDWCRDGKLGVDLLFDNNSYDEMQNALKQAQLLEERPKEGQLIQVLTGKAVPSFEQKSQYQSGKLNQSQQTAVQKIIEARELTIVHGPPGTGKTTTLVQAIQALIAQGEKQILVVAPSNTAVDLLSDKLSATGINVLRIGNPARVSEHLMNLTLDDQIAKHSYAKQIKSLKKQAAEYQNMAHKYKRSFGKAEREQRKALFNEAHKIIREVEQTEQHIIDDLVAKAQVITATLVGSNHYTICNLKFNTVVIDEAGQALEPACWIPLLKAEKCILAGDHLQLPPTIKSTDAARGGLSTTLLEKCTALHPEAVVLLEQQYRMNETIMGFSSAEFYQNKLSADASVANQLLFNGDNPLTFIDTAGCGFDEKLEGTSTTNDEEAAFLIKHLERLVSDLKTCYTDDNFPTIAVISPYKEQVRILNQYVAESAILKTYEHQISVNTIDSFQGQERDVVYIGMTRSNTSGEIGFLTDVRRMNVAMTRARKKLVVVGDSSTISQFKFYNDFILYAEKVNGYESAWEHLGT